MATDSRLVLVVIGSVNDLEQCVDGLEYLKEAMNRELVYHVQIEVLSAHRNLEELLTGLNEFCLDEQTHPDAIIAGAGWSNALVGLIWGYLRYQLHLVIPVIGVAFEDLSGAAEAEERNLAAVLGFKHVPGSDIIYVPPSCTENAFLAAARYATEGILPEIQLPKPRESQCLSLAEALTLGHEQQANRRA